MHNRPTMQARFFLLFYGLLCSSVLSAEPPVFEIEIINHLFIPSELLIPANTKVKFVAYNRDTTPEEFESYVLNRGKLILGNRKTMIFIGPLPVGEYPFFGGFHPDTAQGKLIVE